MRIILDYRPALRERTGVGEYVHELARALAAATRDRPGDTVVAFSSSWKDRLSPEGLDGIQTVDARVPVRVLNFAWHRLEWPPVERFAGTVDIAHSAHPLLMPSRDGAQVVTIHDLDFLDHPERTRGEIRRDYPRLAPAHARRADLVVVSSRRTGDQVANKLGVRDERIVLCPAGAPAWVPRGRTPAQGYFLFVGTLEPRKNLGALLDAYARLIDRLPSAPALRLAGGTTPAAAAWLERVARPPLSGRVSHLGYVPPAGKRELYAGAIALVIPSLYEGFGLTALEAMALGVPVIASDRGSLPEVIGDAAMFVDPEDVDSMAAAMEKVATDEAIARELSQAGVRRAGAFSWARSAESLRRAYDEVLRRRRVDR
ncbi:MAG TPA: glycosyltransferase family 1 protein [Vicinamibacterales bacterium]|nr:glycosyltransferase family 1 protein [Vicinamibacterales bacterium]